MKALLFTLALYFAMATTAYATGEVEVGKISAFIEKIIKFMTTLGGVISSGFFAWGGYGYMTSSGSPDALERSKKTIMYAAVGLSITISAFVLSTTVSQMAQDTFQ